MNKLEKKKKMRIEKKINQIKLCVKMTFALKMQTIEEELSICAYLLHLAIV